MAVRMYVAVKMPLMIVAKQGFWQAAEQTWERT